jgi:hypothetical protein
VYDISGIVTMTEAQNAITRAEKIIKKVETELE